ncbi:Tuftelin [Dissostichus eleginoides]|uniref:Tuftelin n=1 Tax=Dissostichus eleginoides TaxID=100907 RepID=A0AAD9EZY0_DISEL|nr:Tuftelin [Dissostichus eleginoides]
MDTANANAGGASASLIASSAQAESNSKILEAIHSLRADVTIRNDEILAAISAIKVDLSSYSGRLTQAEDRIGETEDNVTVLHNTVDGMEKVITALTEKVDDL